jgi:hypothetical protein
MTIQRQPSDHRTLATIGAILFVLTVALMLVGLEKPLAPVVCDFAKPILCAEFPTSGAHLDALLTSPPNASWQWQWVVWLDMPFLIAYGALLALSARHLAGPGRLGQSVSILAIAGAALDVAENVALLVASGAETPTDALAGFTALAASAKFTLLGLAAAGLGVLALRQRRQHPIEAFVTGLGGVLALGGAAPGWFIPRAFEFGALGIALTCLALWVRALVRLRQPPA